MEKRILAVYIRPDQSNIMLKIVCYNDTDKSFEHILTKKVSASNWINLKISQKSVVNEVKIDYKLVSKIHFPPKTWAHVNLMTENTYGKENVSTFVYYRNFKITTCTTKGKSSIRLQFSHELNQGEIFQN